MAYTIFDKVYDATGSKDAAWSAYWATPEDQRDKPVSLAGNNAVQLPGGNQTVNNSGSNSGGYDAYAQQKADQDKRENDALDNLASISNYNANAIRWKANHGMEMYDTADEQARRLADAQTEQNKRNIGADWFEQMKKLQASTNKLKNQGGDGFSGSSLYDFINLLETENDNIRDESLNTQRKNQDEINNDLYETIAQNVNARNELLNDTEYGLANIVSDYAAQATTIAPDKIKERGLFSPDEGVGAGSINNPGWVNPDGYYDQNKRGPAEVTKQGLYTEADAQKNANNINNRGTNNTSAAANPGYWEELFKGYGRRY